MHVRFAQVEPTTRCNFTCGFCVGRHMVQRNLSLDTFTTFIESVEGLEHLELQGEGEPLLHPEFFELVRVARSRFPAVEISMITNGSLFTEKNVQRILDNRIRKIFVSVESVDDERFRAIRGGKLDRVRRGLRRLIEARNAQGLRHPTIGLTVTVLRSTVAEIGQAIPRFYREQNLDGGISVQGLQVMPAYTLWYGDDINNELLRPEDGVRVRRDLQQGKELRSAMQERYVEPGFYEQLYGSVDNKVSCPWLVNGIYLSTDGSVLPCCHVKDYQRFALDRVPFSGPAPGERVLATRARMQQLLTNARIPAPCMNCDVAVGIATHARARSNAGPGGQPVPGEQEAKPGPG